MTINLGFTLSYEGNDADKHEIDFYDMSQALIGFQRSLALTTHLVLNGEVITQAPSLKGARIIALPPEEGSWKIAASIIIGTVGSVYALGTAPKETPIGNIVASAYDYMISETLGFHIDYKKTLGQQYEELKKTENIKIPVVSQSQLDSIIEKCEYNILQMHRPITFSKTAVNAKLISTVHGKDKPLNHPLNTETYEYVSYTKKSSETYEIIGRVSSYNINTFKGRIFIPEEKRPIPFMLSDNARSSASIVKITSSLTMNAQNRFKDGGNIKCLAFKNLSRTGRLKSLYIVEITE